MEVSSACTHGYRPPRSGCQEAVTQQECCRLASFYVLLPGRHRCMLAADLPQDCVLACVVGTPAYDQQSCMLLQVCSLPFLVTGVWIPTTHKTPWCCAPQQHLYVMLDTLGSVLPCQTMPPSQSLMHQVSRLPLLFHPTSNAELRVMVCFHQGSKTSSMQQCTHTSSTCFFHLLAMY